MLNLRINSAKANNLLYSSPSPQTSSNIQTGVGDKPQIIKIEQFQAVNIILMQLQSPPKFTHFNLFQTTQTTQRLEVPSPSVFRSGQ